MADPESLNCFISEVVSYAVSETASALFAPIGIQPKCIHCGEGGNLPYIHSQIPAFGGKETGRSLVKVLVILVPKGSLEPLVSKWVTF